MSLEQRVDALERRAGIGDGGPVKIRVAEVYPDGTERTRKFVRINPALKGVLPEPERTPAEAELLRAVEAYLNEFETTDALPPLWRECAESVTQFLRADTPEETQHARQRLERAGEAVRARAG